MNVPDRLILIIHHYLTDRQFMFKHENTYSTRRPIRAGVPQGSTLSPLLYSAYTNDIPRPSSGVQLALFADDTALYLRGATERNIGPHLQRAVDELGRWFQIWRIEVNPDKSAAISFIYRKGRSSVVVERGTPPRIYNAPIPWQHNYKYLGITLDRNLHFRDHIKRVRKTAIFYMSRLKVLHRDLDIPSIAKYMKDASERFFSIAETHSNPLLSAAVSYEAPPPYHFIRRPRNALADPPDDFTAEVERLIEINKQNDD
ncbi:RNA-directed DNA polymerase from mobile element jockey [Eumeta japonica]|uniref:RNA-directed DNA polymerase from mobile element jockey n=1 Tax=Eumeta variegata TaxID=151549 RepID=A0A4C1XWR7_EUMVA|nr:RNA-directed DNA polymerase from mobile element jockey [Eumeta japonica]